MIPIVDDSAIRSIMNESQQTPLVMMIDEWYRSCSTLIAVIGLSPKGHHPICLYYIIHTSSFIKWLIVSSTPLP
jgi:hypothetical protein